METLLTNNEFWMALAAVAGGALAILGQKYVVAKRLANLLAHSIQTYAKTTTQLDNKEIITVLEKQAQQSDVSEKTEAILKKVS